MSVNDEFLSEHTVAMRKAVAACQSLLASSHDEEEQTVSFRLDPDITANATIASLDARRNKALLKWTNESNAEEDFWETIHHHHLHQVTESTAWQFRQRFQQANQPCRIHGLTESCFSRVQTIWRSPQNFRQWMKKIVPSTPHLLPVRRTGLQETALDEEGRAKECVTVNMSLNEWIAYLDYEDAQSLQDQSSKDYLKDWHFEALLEDQSLAVSTSKLYQVPDIFEHDLLNPFLRAFTKGDYRFIYWGPAGSRTGWHSDVLNSFSWSYNVYGSKEWTFEIPRTNRRLNIVQKAGECIFVPAAWKHQVVNLEETLSINRNWLTAANLDLSWNCLTAEIRSIENELASWGSDYDWEARESMLRGCVGLDVTAFYLMVLYRLGMIRKEIALTSGEGSPVVPDKGFEIYRCIDTLQRLFRDESLHLEERLMATLANAEIAQTAKRLGWSVCEHTPVLS